MGATRVRGVSLMRWKVCMLDIQVRLLVGRPGALATPRCESVHDQELRRVGASPTGFQALLPSALRERLSSPRPLQPSGV